jgi:cytochrome c oxidase cbb3-type subunit 3
MAKHKGTTPPAGTTGHAWDGIEELNTPLPRWWVWLFYATIVWSFGYWVVYPTWPTISGYTRGLIGYSTRAQVAADLADLRKVRGEKGAALEQTSLADIERNPALLAFAQAQGKAAFANNCAPCHGVGATGAKGYPNLNDDDWLWGGSLTEIRDTIAYGVRSGDPKDHESAMPAFGKTGMLTPDDIIVAQTLCAPCPAFRCAPAPISQTARRSLPTTAPDAMATMARATKTSARPT